MSTPTPVDFIPVLLPDGSLPAESQAFVSQQVQQEAGQFVTDAQAAQAAAEAARDAALAAVPHIIVGAGRPDIAGTLDPDTAARVAAAPSGAVFRSTDAPQGAWEWMKRGSAWTLTVADSGWRNVASDWLSNSFTLASIAGRAQMRLLNGEVFIEGRVAPAESILGTSRALSVLLMSLPVDWGLSSAQSYGTIDGVVRVPGLQSGVLVGDPARDIRVRELTGTWAASDTVSFIGKWPLSGALPASLPGTPA